MGTCKIPEPSLDYAGVASGCLCQGHISSRGQCCGTWGCRAMGWAAVNCCRTLINDAP